MKKIILSSIAMASLLVGINTMSVRSASALTLPTPQCGLAAGDTCLKFDDFTVYSLALLQWNTYHDTLNSGDKYYVDSSDLKDDIVIISRNPGAQADNSDIGPNIDNAYVSTKPLFQMSTDNLWDMRISELNKFLGEDDFVMYFNLNELDGIGLNKEDLLGWMTVYLTDSTGTNPTKAFTLSGNNTDYPFVQSQAQAGTDAILPQPDDLWAYVHGQICVAANGTVSFGACGAGGGTTVKQNIGANAAAFGLWNEDLNNLIKSGLYDVLTVDARLSHLDNGDESLFIRATTVGEPVPEPATMLLFGAGLSGLGLVGSRARRKK